MSEPAPQKLPTDAEAPASQQSHSFISRVREAVEQLSRSERKLGVFVLEFPGNLASYSASEIAQLTGVSNATVTRFVYRLGYASYEEARRHARQGSHAGAALFVPPEQGSSDPHSAMAAHLAQAQANMAATLQHISAELIDAIARAMLKARQLNFVGFRQNRNFAAYLRWQLMQVLPRPPQLIPGPGETLGEYAAHLGEGDVVVIFALRRSTPAAQAFAAQARRCGASVLYITDTYAVDLNVNWLLRCHTQAPSALDNHSAVMMLCHLLATRTMELGGAPTRRLMASIEAAHDSLQEM